MQLNRLVVFFISIGYAVLAFEIFLQHYDQLFEKKIMWTPIIFGIFASLFGFLIVFIFNRITYYLFFILMILSMCVGGLGLFLHNRWRFPKFVDFLFHGKPFDFEILTTYTPMLAPSAFIAMGGLGILVALFHRWDD